MNLGLTERLDSEIKGPIKEVLRVMPPTSFDDLPAARAAKKIAAALK